jgi:regulatory protein
MPTITKISAQVKRPDRYSIYVDGRYYCPLSDLDLVTSGLQVGQELSEAELAAVATRSRAAKAFDQALRFLSYRPRTRAEIRDYLLRRKGYEPELTEQVIGRLVEQGYIDDQAFARVWTESRQTLRPRSRRMIEQELRRKHVDAETVKTTLAAVTAEDELQAARAIAAKKKTQSQYRDESKLLAYLMRQGFDYSTSRQALAGQD